MATIAIRMTPEYSGTLATLALTRRLRERGHRTVYFAARGVAELVARNGIEIEVIPDDVLFPSPDEFDEYEVEGLLATLAGGLEAAGASPWVPARVSRRARRAALTLLGRAAEAGEIQRKNAIVGRAVARLRPDLALVDVIVPWATLPFLEHGARVVNANPSLAGRPSLAYPNLLSRLAPARSDRIATALRALRALPRIRHAVAGRAADWFALYPLAGFSLRRALRRAGVGLRIHDLGFRTDLPELVLMPAAFDYPAARRPDRCYAGSLIEESRGDAAFDWARVRRDRPLAYCSLGTLGTPQLRRRVFAAVIDAFRRRPGWEVVISAGGVAVDLRGAPNVVVVDFAPQLAMLARAKLFITHAGAGSIREALHYGVPIVALPYGGDQYGLAARVEYHGLGRAGDAWTVNPSTLAGLIDEVIADRRIDAALARMSRACSDRRELDGAVAFLERRCA